MLSAWSRRALSGLGETGRGESLEQESVDVRLVPAVTDEVHGGVGRTVSGAPCGARLISGPADCSSRRIVSIPATASGVDLRQPIPRRLRNTTAEEADAGYDIGATRVVLLVSPTDSLQKTNKVAPIATGALVCKPAIRAGHWRSTLISAPPTSPVRTG